MENKGRSIKLSNGVEISFFEQGDQNGTPLVLVPGMADSWRIFERLIPHLPQSLHLFALTQRGHGDSSRPLTGYQTSDFEADLYLFLDALQLNKAVLAGASSGGFSARSFAADHPERTVALILMGCPATLKGNQTVLAIWESAISKLDDPVSREFAEHFSRELFSRPLSADFLQMMLQENLKLPARVWRETTQGILAEEFPGKLFKIICPTLILWGEEDGLLEQSSQKKMAQIIPNARLISQKEAGHLLYCKAPEETALQIIVFIGEVLSANR